MENLELRGMSLNYIFVFTSDTQWSDRSDLSQNGKVVVLDTLVIVEFRVCLNCLNKIPYILVWLTVLWTSVAKLLFLIF